MQCCDDVYLRVCSCSVATYAGGIILKYLGRHICPTPSQLLILRNAEFAVHGHTSIMQVRPSERLRFRISQFGPFSNVRLHVRNRKARTLPCHVTVQGVIESALQGGEMRMFQTSFSHQNLSHIKPLYCAVCKCFSIPWWAVALSAQACTKVSSVFSCLMCTGSVSAFNLLAEHLRHGNSIHSPFH